MAPNAQGHVRNKSIMFCPLQRHQITQMKITHMRDAERIKRRRPARRQDLRRLHRHVRRQMPLLQPAAGQPVRAVREQKLADAGPMVLRRLLQPLTVRLALLVAGLPLGLGGGLYERGGSQADPLSSLGAMGHRQLGDGQWP